MTLALAVDKQADLLVLDEPRELETTMLLSSHIVADLAEICDHPILLDGGRGQLCGSVTDLLDSHSATTLAELVLHHLRAPGIVR